MRPVVSADEMRWCDEFTIKKLGVPGLLLMENAGSSVARVIQETYGPLHGKTAAVFCGKGNNGGDGFVVARRLLNQGVKVTVVLAVSPADFKGDAKKNYEILRRFERSNNSLQLQKFSSPAMQLLRPDIIIDAIFGTGFSGKVREPFVKIITWINDQSVPVVSVDIPSGVNGTTGVVENVAVRATETVTFAFEKVGLLCNHGRELAGRLTVVDIGIPHDATRHLKRQTLLVDVHDIRMTLPRRPHTAHKYSVGKIFVLAGSKGLTGAAAMCSIAALRAGAGAVVLGTPEAVYSVLARKLNEVMVTPLPSTPEGSVAEAAYTQIEEKLAWADVAVVGPGLSQNSETQSLVRRLIRSAKGKILLDADGLNAMSSDGMKELKSCRGELILTPHAGEYARLFKSTSSEVEHNRVEVARAGARSTGKVLVLKGSPTITAGRSGKVYLNSSGNAGMATAGAGDVLAGVIAGFWAQGMKSEQAASAGVYTHGVSGDLAKKRFGERSLLAMDLIDRLPEALQMIEAGGEVN